jgi:predicted DNA-binding ArsR family transcriptional regulator
MEKEEFNRQINLHVSLDFELNDIKYLILKTDKEISQLISHLRKANSHIDPNIVDRLTSRIVTAEQIETDI